MREFLFHPAFWMPAVGFVIAIALFIFGNNRVKPPIRNGGLGLFLLVIAWCAAAYLVETPVEACIARTKSIVVAVEKNDWPRLKALLDKTTALEFLHGRDDITNATQTAAASYGLKDIRILTTTAIEGPGTVDVTFTALLEGEQPLTATFRFEYEHRSDGMLLSKIEPLQVGDRSMDDVRRAIR